MNLRSLQSSSYHRGRIVAVALALASVVWILPGCSVTVEMVTPKPTSVAIAATPTVSPAPTNTATPATSPTPTVAPSPTVAGQGAGTPGPTVAPPTVTPDPKARFVPTRQAPSTRIAIPSIQLDSEIVEVGVAYQDGKLVWQTPPFVVGHYLASANPGEGGNAVFSGHISTPSSGSVFKHLPDVKIGDEIKLFSGDVEHDYVVSDKQVVEPTNLTPMNPSKTEMVTLITCVPDGVYTQRLIVTARPKG